MLLELSITLVALGMVFLLSIPTGKYIARVYSGDKTFLTGILRPIESGIYRICGIDETEEMNWKTYTWVVVWFNLVFLIAIFLLEILQGYLPLNPQRFSGVRWDTALNTAISFLTNTNWQSYGGETTMSYLTQMLGMTVHNFVTPAMGMAVMVAMIRGFIRKDTDTLGNYWVDMTRSILYILLPLSIIIALVLVSQGVVQTLHPYITAKTLEGGPQTIAVGPAASQIAIKQLGTNGGGFFNANSAHPYENPNGTSNLVEVLSIIFIASAQVFAFGYLAKDIRQGRAIFCAMLILFLIGLSIVLVMELQGTPILGKLHIIDGNMEGKETRFGIINSAIWGLLTTVTSNGSVNSMHDSMLPITGLVYMFNMCTGEVIFGGLGVGLIGMLFYVFTTMFIAGLMIGRTPEYLGKKLGPYEMVWTVIAILAAPLILKILAAIAISTSTGLSSLNNPSAHGWAEVLYGYLSTGGNNGSAFAGLNANTIFYNLSMGFNMLVGRFATLIPGLAVAGALVKKKIVPPSLATFPTDSWLFVIMLVSVVFIVGALTYFPAFTLGPILEHLFMIAGKTF
ncbi:MAG: potassium-transporting ATPase subunit KdpA [bacterium]